MKTGKKVRVFTPLDALRLTHHNTHMEIISRQQAITLDVPHYFTGQPCKRGHVARRYTSNAGCEDCLHPKITRQPRERKTALVKAAKKEMTRKRFRVYPEHLDIWQATVHAYAMRREPHLRLEDVLSNRKSEAGFIYTFRVHPDDCAALRSLEVNLERAASKPWLTEDAERRAALAKERDEQEERERTAARESAIRSFKNNS